MSVGTGDLEDCHLYKQALRKHTRSYDRKKFRPYANGRLRPLNKQEKIVQFLEKGTIDYMFCQGVSSEEGPGRWKSNSS